MNPELYRLICSDIANYNFDWNRLGSMLINAAASGLNEQAADETAHNPARLVMVKTLRQVLDLSLADSVKLADLAIDIAKKHGQGLDTTKASKHLQSMLDTFYYEKGIVPYKEDDDDDLAAEASLDAEPVSNSFGVVRYYNDGDTSEIDYLVLFNDGPQWSNHAGNATRMDLTTANGFCYIYNKYFGLEESGFHCYLVAFT